MAGLEGTNVGPYEIKALLGAGGMGQVYRGHDPRLERDVAIKVLSASLAQEPGYLERFRREARAVARLNHPNIVQVYDFGEQGDLTYLVMPLISGGTLRDYLAHRQVLPLAEALAITEQVASALQYAHERGLVHRDVKPANILMTAEGRALLSDFGIVRLVQKEDNATTLTHLGAFVGSPEYAAPEMILGKPVDQRVDVYALGVILFQMLTGRMPFSGATPVVLMMMQAQQPPPPPRSLNPDIPPAVEAVILKALAKEPGERFQTAAELLAALRAASAAPAAGAGYTQAQTVGEVSNLPTIISTNTPPAGSGPAVYAPPGPGSVTPYIWPTPGSGPSSWPAPGSGPAGWANPASGPSSWANPGSGPAGWATPGSGPAAAPPLAPTFATGLSAPPNQPPVAPRPSTPPRRRWPIYLAVLVLAFIVVGGSLGALSIFSNKSGTPPPSTTSTTRVPTATATFTPTPTPTPLPAGTIAEFTVPTAGSAPWGITAGPDGSLWFTEQKSNKIGRITPQGAITEYRVPTSDSNPLNIAAGTDGNLWFTEYTGNKIGRITPRGAITEYPVPTSNSVLWGIMAGPDGNIWFTERSGNKIGRITPQGVIKEFEMPTPNSDPLEMTVGTDGNIWFTDYHGNQIGRITPQGAITEYPVPTPRSEPWGIVTGPDGNLWFTEYAGNQIGRMTLQGVFTEFPVPGRQGNPVGIAVGSDRNLWFTEYHNKIVRITPQGAATAFSIPASANFPVEIVSGPDRNLWFAETTSNQIGRISTGK